MSTATSLFIVLNYRFPFFSAQMELRKVSQEKEKVQAENDKLQYDLERVAIQNNKSQSALEKSQEEVARLQVRLATKRLCCYTKNESAFYQYCRHRIRM